ncbi:MAG: MerR family transcriptional regulator [Thermodesulfobacteriota bacterium]
MVARKKTAIQPLRPDLPIYPIGVAARLLDVHPRTLRIYEEEGLIEPAQHGSRRLYSPNDIKWISCLRSMIHDQGISIPGLKRLLALAPCWEVADCPAEVHEACDARWDKAPPRTMHVAGDEAAEKKAKAAELAKKKSSSGRDREQAGRS